MVTKKYKVSWHRNAKHSLRLIYNYIKKGSVSSARKVKAAILQETRKLNTSPERYSKEYFMKEESGNFRYIPIWSYKIIYEVTETKVIILEIFHTSRSPDEIQNIKQI